MDCTVTIADLPFRKPDAELAHRLACYMPVDHLPAAMVKRADWPGPNLQTLGLPNPPPPSLEIGLGCLWYPCGMSRHAIYHGIMHTADVTALGKLVQAAPGTALTFKMASGDATVSTPMFVLPPRPCVEDGLYLVTLVDDRFFRAGSGAGKIRPDGTLTWASLITALATALGVTLTSASVDAAYYKPEPDSGLYSSNESAAALLDMAAANVGRVVVRNLDGTYKLEEYSAGNTAAAANRLDADGSVLSSLWGGKILPVDPATASDWRPMVVPASVVVTFPKWVTGSGYYEPSTYRQYRKDSYGDVYEKTVTLADLGAPYSGWTAGPGKKVVRTTAKAEFADAAAAAAGTSPTNGSDLTTLAQRQAKDFYDSTAAALDETYLGVVARQLDGATDCVWCVRDGEIYTRVVRRPFEYGSSERQQCINALSPVADNHVDNVHVVNVYDDSHPPVLIGWQVERVTLGSGSWPPTVADPRVVYETVFESENRDPRLRDEPGDPGDPSTHIIPLFKDVAGNYYIVFWVTNTSYTEDVLTYSWNVDTCVMTTTTTNYTTTLTVTSPGIATTGLTLSRFVTPPPPPP